MMRLLEENGLTDVTYIEPCAGGASIALALLLEEYASAVHFNDLSRPIYAFWHTVLNDTAALCRRIEHIDVTMEEWQRQRGVYDNREHADLFDLGFATLFLNRTNRSGIIAGGVIGGRRQTSAWSLDARFNKTELIRRIRKVGRYKSRINLHQLDALQLTNELLPQLGPNAFVFYDPPYIDKGEALYLNEYTLEDHQRLAERILQLPNPWVVTYDYEAAVRHDLYPSCLRVAYQLSYSAQARYGGKEVMFLSNRLRLPASWISAAPFRMVPERSEHPFYGVVEEIQQPPHGG